MPKIKIDNTEFDTDTFNQEAKNRLEMLVTTERRLKELQLETAIMQTARNAYFHSLKEVLPTAAPVSAPPATDDGILKFS